MTIVVDASVAVKWVCNEEGGDRAATLLDGRPLLAPDIWLIEVANALWRRVRSREFSFNDAESRLNFLHDSPVRSLASEVLLGSALHIANALSHPIYDCLYLAAALQRSTYVVTADRRFYAATRDTPHYAEAVKLL